MYTVASAQLPEPPEGADRLFVAPNAVIVLDGASAFGPANPDPATYVDRLGSHLRDALVVDPGADLRCGLADAIEATADELGLTPGLGPSSTVAMARWIDDRVDLLVLGDSQITTPLGVLRDDRLDRVATAARAAYRSRLAEGHGYDDRHRELLAELQAEQAVHRNRTGGYWIAEADPSAADHAITKSHPTSAVPWLALATDGAYRLSEFLGIEVDPAATSDQIAAVLSRCVSWEAKSDPGGSRLPRSKRHDDKTLVILRHVDG